MLSTRAISSVVTAVLLAAGARLVAADRIAYHDGTEIGGTILGIDDDVVRIDVDAAAGNEEERARAKAVALYEIGAIQFRRDPASRPRKSVEDVPGPVVCFRTGQLLAGSVTETKTVPGSADGAARIDVATVASSAGPLDVPLELLRGFRLQRPHQSDALFRGDLDAAMGAAADPLRSSVAPEDRVYVVRGRQLLMVGGVFRHLDDKTLAMEYKGETRRIPRSRVFGVILAPAAARRVESGYPAVCRLTSGDEFPAMVVGLNRNDAGGRELLLRFRGSPPQARQTVPVERIEQVSFFSDRVAFLSDLSPVRAKETSVIGSTTAFPWRRDGSTAGGGIKLAGRMYRKGLGVHAYSSLEFDIGGRYSTFAATIGLIDKTDEAGEAHRASDAQAAGDPPVAGVTFRVFADDKALFEKDLLGAAAPQRVLLPVPGIERLRLEVDYGKDGFDFGDHAAWAEARVIKD